jgi:hypothetical protein
MVNEKEMVKIVRLHPQSGWHQDAPSKGGVHLRESPDGA